MFFHLVQGLIIIHADQEDLLMPTVSQLLDKPGKGQGDNIFVHGIQWSQTCPTSTWWWWSHLLTGLLPLARGFCLKFKTMKNASYNRPLHNAPLPAVSSTPLASDPKRWLQPNPEVLSISCQKTCRCCVWSKPVYFKIDGLWFWWEKMLTI